MPDTVLIVEDEPKMGRILQDLFAAHGMEADWVPDGLAALERSAARDYDAVLLDVMMPGLDGYGVCRALRRESTVPILFLTALGGEDHALRGYALGADDYITKPFSLSLLYAKTIRLDTRGKTCTVSDIPVILSPKEYDLLLCLMRNRGRVLSRDQLLTRVWGWDFQGGDRAVDGQIKNLRASLGPAGRQIKTVFKAGYKLEEA